MSKRGFSLFEILVSLIILSIAVTGILVLYASTKKFILHGRSTFTGTELGKVFLDPLQEYVRQDTWGDASNCLSNPTTGCPGPQTSPSTNITYTPVYTITPFDPTGGSNPTLIRVRSDINWTEPTP